MTSVRTASIHAPAAIAALLVLTPAVSAAEAALFTEPVPEVATETVDALSPLLIGAGITYRF